MSEDFTTAQRSGPHLNPTSLLLRHVACPAPCLCDALWRQQQGLERIYLRRKPKAQHLVRLVKHHIAHPACTRGHRKNVERAQRSRSMREIACWTAGGCGNAVQGVPGWAGVGAGPLLREKGSLR